MSDLPKQPLASERTAGSLPVLLALVLAGLLSACAGGGANLAKSGASSANTAPPITVVDMQGIPAEKARMLTDFMAEAAGKRDIAIVQGAAFGTGYRLDGAFTAKANSSGTVLGYQWTMADAAGQVVHSFSGTETAAKASGDPWSAAAPDVLQRIAAGTADNLATRLSELGYAIRTAARDKSHPSVAVPIPETAHAFTQSECKSASLTSC
jgi:hypothetical protein